jgi:heme exporter protein D
MSLLTGPYVGFIAASYAFAVVIVGGLIAAAVIDHRSQLKALRNLEERGVRRRSLRSSGADRPPAAPAGEGA